MGLIQELLKFKKNGVLKKLVVDGETIFQKPSGTKSISSNGTYNISDYDSVSVNVPTGITPSGTKYITSNGTYDISSYAKVSVSVNSTVTYTKSSLSYKQGSVMGAGTLSFSVSKACQAILVIPQATTYNNSIITIRGCVTSQSVIGPYMTIVKGDVIRLSSTAYLLNLNRGTLYVDFEINTPGTTEMNGAILIMLT